MECLSKQNKLGMGAGGGDGVSLGEGFACTFTLGSSVLWFCQSRKPSGDGELGGREVGEKGGGRD